MMHQLCRMWILWIGSSWVWRPIRWRIMLENLLAQMCWDSCLLVITLSTSQQPPNEAGCDIIPSALCWMERFCNLSHRFLFPGCFSLSYDQVLCLSMVRTPIHLSCAWQNIFFWCMLAISHFKAPFGSINDCYFLPSPHPSSLNHG